MTFDTAIALISGFRESEKAASGTERTHGMVSTGYGHVAKVYDLRPWDHDMRGFARKMLRDGIKKLIGIGYSWGGGFGLMRLIRECAKVGIVCILALTCDAVYRPLWLSTKLPANVLALRSILPWSVVIDLPHSVQRFAGVWQSETIPSGHKIRTGPKTEYGGMQKLPYPHTEIDDAPEWRRLVVRELDYIFHPQ